MRNSNRFSRSLRYEALEDRQMMAGFVSAYVEAGVLKVVGDDLSNGVEIRETGKPGCFDVVGYNWAGRGTLINGRAHQVFCGVTQGIEARLNGGSDRLWILGSDSTRPLNVGTAGLSVDMGDGNNDLLCAFLNVAGACVINGQDGGDDFEVAYSQFRAGLSIRTSGGADVLSLCDCQVGRRLAVDMGQGNDMMGLQSVVADTLQVSMGGGDDTLGIADLHCIVSRPTFDGGEGRDSLRLTRPGGSRVDAVLMNWEYLS